MTTADLARAVATIHAHTNWWMWVWDGVGDNAIAQRIVECQAAQLGLTVSWQPATTGLRVPVFSVVEEGAA